MKPDRLYPLLSLVIFGCATWRNAPPNEVSAAAPEERILVVGDDGAYEVEVQRVDAGKIHGSVLRAWNVPSGTQTKETGYLSSTSDSPESIARRLGWHERTNGQGREVTLDADKVTQLRKYDPQTGMTAIAVVSGVVLVGGLITFLIILASGALFVACGRPLRVRGRRVITPTVDSAEWAEDGPAPVRPVPDSVRATLIEIWTEEAQSEHAAIAAFSKLSLELMALGAPPDLVARANRAAIQEVEHARLCFSLASAYAGRAIGPGPLPQALAGHRPDLRRLARESLLDGCLREGIAATIAKLGAEHAKDPAVARVLRVQYKEETQHAALGWSIVEWCISREGQPMRAMLEKSIDDAELPRCDDLPEHGRVSAALVRPFLEDLCAQARARLGSASYAEAA